MFSKTTIWLVVCVGGVVAASMEAQGQSSTKLLERLERAATDDPTIAQALEELSRARESTSYTVDEVRQYARIDWTQFYLAPNGITVLAIPARGSGTVNSILGSGVEWTDESTGRTHVLSYEAHIGFSETEGLTVTVTVQPPEGAATSTLYRLGNFAAVTVVLQEMSDGSRHVARFVPRLQLKESIVDLADHLPVSLVSAVLVVDDEFAGEFTTTGPIVGITSRRAGMRFEFALEPFGDAVPIGRTDGRMAQWDFDGRHYRLYGSQPITVTPTEGMSWTLYVRGEAVDAAGDGTHSKTFGSYRIAEVLDSLGR